MGTVPFSKKNRPHFKITKKGVEKMQTAWQKVQIARASNRKTSLDYIEKIFDEFIELHGDRCYGDDKAMVCGLGRIENQNYTIIAEQTSF